MILFLVGDDSYRRQERVRFLKEAFQAKYDEKGFNIAEVDGAYFNIDEFRKQVKSAGLFVSKRFVVLTNVWQLSKEEQVALKEELDSLGDTDTILCVVADDPPRQDNALFKRLLRADKVEKYAELNAGQLRSFIRQKCKEQGAVIDNVAVEQLAANIGNDLWRMNYELKKLCNFTKQITPAAVAEFITDALDENIFHLTDAMGARDVKKATALLQQQFELDANAQYLITMLARQIGIIAKVQATPGGNLHLHPYVIEKARQQARHFNARELRVLYWRLLEIDYHIKTRATDPRVLLDIFMVQACAGKSM